MTVDYYEVLKLERSASEDDVRRAYRRMAKEFHPDVNPDDSEADQNFKAINEAYEVLRDPQKRAMYDRFGHAGVGRGAGPGPVGVDGFGDLGSIFEQFFGVGMGGRARSQGGPVPEQGADLRTSVHLAFEEAIFGVTRSVEVTRRELCDTCHGSGAAAGTKPMTCTACAGKGQVRQVQQSVFGNFVNVATCRECGGRGEVVAERCPACSGKGRVARTRHLDVDIPAGVDEGTQIRLNGQGDQGLFGGPPGDLYVVLEVAPHAAFERDGNNLHLELHINPADAALGTQVTVPTLGGPVPLRIPPATQSGDGLTLPGQGVPYLRRAGRGDLVVTVHVITPERLSREQKELMEALRATLPPAEVVERTSGGGSFWDKVREKFA